MGFRYNFRPLKLYGGGALNVLAYDSSSQVLIAGGDIEGIFRSDDFGDNWRAINRGFYNDQHHRVACVAWSQTEANTLYACVGDQGASGGFFASTNGGTSWTLRSTTVQFSGNHASSPLPGSHPRSTGSLLAQGGGNLYVGTYSQGVYRSTDNGNTWTNVGLSGGTHYARSLVRDPSDPNTLYVAMYNENVWKTTNASAPSPTWTQLTNAPAIVEELKFVGSYLYAACNTSGIYRSTDGGSTWANLNGTTLNTVKSIWLSLDGYVSGANHVLIVGCKTGVVTAGVGAASLVKLVIDSGGNVTYTTLSNIANVDLTIGPGGRTWWHAGSVKYQDWLSGSFYVPTFILIDPTNTNRIWVSGTEGVFRSLDGGTNWKNINEGISVTSHRRVAFDPSRPNRVLLATTDWTTFEVSDAIAENAGTTASGAPSKAGVAYDVAVEPTTGRMYACVGNRDTNTEGKLFSRAYGASSWTDEQIAGLGNYDPAITDTFNRTASNGWGTADLGGAWTIQTGSAASFAVSNGTGTIQLPASAGSRNIFLNSINVQDSEGTFDFEWSARAVGNSHQIGIMVRAFAESGGTATDNGYNFRVEENPAGYYVARIHKFVAAGAAQQVGSNITLDIPGGSPLSVRYRMRGTDLNFKVWSGAEEPEDWTITTSDSTAGLQTSGAIGIRVSSSSGYTSGAAVSVSNLNVDMITINPLDPGDKRPLGVCLLRDAGNNLVLLTAVEQDGMWRKVGSTWSKVDSTILASAQVSRSCRFVWQTGTPYVYVFDRASGVYRSADYGVSWTQIWATTSDVGKTGFLALNPAVPHQLWVSQQSGLYRLDNANTGTVGGGITATQINTITKPGALTISSEGVLYCVDLPSSSNSLKLLKSLDGGANWQDIADDTYRNMGNRISDLVMSPTGRLYITTLCNGVILGHSIGQHQNVM